MALSHLINLKKLKILAQGYYGQIDGQMCIDTPFLAVERLLPHYCFHYGVEGYEFWGFDWLTYDPYEFGWHSLSTKLTNQAEVTGFAIPMAMDIWLTQEIWQIKTNTVHSFRTGLWGAGEDYEYLYLLKQK